jgi:pilus assembly protein Flp/PilA
MDVWRAQGVLGAMPKWGRHILLIRPSVTTPRKPVTAATAVARRLRRADDGVTAIEYGLIAALIAVVIIGAVSMAGDELKYTFETLSNSISAVNSGDGSDDDRDPCQQGGVDCGGGND